MFLSIKQCVNAIWKSICSVHLLCRPVLHQAANETVYLAVCGTRRPKFISQFQPQQLCQLNLNHLCVTAIVNNNYQVKSVKVTLHSHHHSFKVLKSDPHALILTSEICPLSRFFGRIQQKIHAGVRCAVEGGSGLKLAVAEGRMYDAETRKRTPAVEQLWTRDRFVRPSSAGAMGSWLADGAVKTTHLFSRGRSTCQAGASKGKCRNHDSWGALPKRLMYKPLVLQGWVFTQLTISAEPNSSNSTSAKACRTPTMNSDFISTRGT
jgi:hypothetical protein